MWTNEDKAKISAAVLTAIQVQKFVGDKQLGVVLEAWERLLGKDWTAEQVLAALWEYLNKKNDFPAPADILSILARQNTKEIQYKNACKLIEMFKRGQNRPQAYYTALEIKKSYEGSKKTLTVSQGL